jgi:hypothetical protein
MVILSNLAEEDRFDLIRSIPGVHVCVVKKFFASVIRIRNLIEQTPAKVFYTCSNTRKTYGDTRWYMVFTISFKQNTFNFQ